MKDYHYFMTLALEEAQKASQLGEVPVGAVLVNDVGKVIERAHNTKEQNNDPAGHAEIELLRKAGALNNNWRLNGTTLFVTLEPCIMCMGAMVHARISTLVFGAYDLKAGALSHGHQLHSDSRLNHQFNIVGGVEHYRCSSMLSNFFKERRK